MSARPDAAYNPAQAESCLSRLAAAIHGCDDSLGLNPIGRACANVYGGTQPIGGACQSMGDCAPDPMGREVVCDFRPDAASPTCIPAVWESASQQTCFPRDGGYAVLCAEDEYCDPTGSCARKLPLGVNCPSPGACASGGTCSDVGDASCVPTTPAGGACSQPGEQSSCGTGLTCDLSGLCVQAQGPGQPCGSDGECGSGYCIRRKCTSSMVAIPEICQGM